MLDQRAADIENYSSILSEQGYVIIPNLLDLQAREEIQQELGQYSDKFGRNNFEGKKTRRIYALLRKCPSVARCFAHPLVTGILDKYLSPGYYSMICQTADIHPGEVAQDIHCDDDAGAPPRPRGPNGISTMWALSDFSADNGATRFIPGSQQWNQEQVAAAAAEQTVAAEMSAGSVLVYMGSVIHGGGHNRSQGDRIAMNLTYNNAWLRQEENQYLTCPPEIARNFDPEFQALLGYTMANYGLGYYSPVEFNPGLPDTLPPEFAVVSSTDPEDADVGSAKLF